MSSVIDQCDIKVSPVIDFSIPRVVPPNTNSRILVWPYPPITMKSAAQSAAWDRIAFVTSISSATYQNTVQLEPVSLNIRHDNHRSSGLKQSSLDEQIVGYDPVGFRLADYR